MPLRGLQTWRTLICLARAVRFSDPTGRRPASHALEAGRGRPGARHHSLISPGYSEVSSSHSLTWGEGTSGEQIRPVIVHRSPHPSFRPLFLVDRARSQGLSESGGQMIRQKPRGESVQSGGKNLTPILAELVRAATAASASRAASSEARRESTARSSADGA